MALHIHRAERTDILADGLGELLATPPADPFAEDLVVVPARGIERWLSQRLSHRLGAGSAGDGVCAGVAFRSPASLISEITGTRDEDPWSPEAMTWPLLEVIDTALDEPWCRTLAAHLGHFETEDVERELRQGRRYGTARRLAGLFASYARQRPELLAGWLDGPGDGLADDLAWQPELWRRLVALTAIDPPHVRHAKTVAQLRQSGLDLPGRISLFGHTRLARTDVELLGALAEHHDVHLWLPHPSAALWATLSTALDGRRGAIPRSADDSHRSVRHPLLSTLGRDLRDLQRALPDGVTADEFLAGGDRPDTLLGWLQSDIAADAVRPAGRALRAGDRSVQVHSCHGPARQVDVLREVLLGLLQDDPTLEPRDILVMCPDIETYAPLIAANFGLGEVVRDAHPAHRLRVKLADRSLVQTNPLLAVAAQVLALAGSRVTASEVLNLACAEPVRARFAFSDDDLEDITDWVRQANIRWGFDRAHRVPFGVDFVQNTWRFGLDRILTGVAMSDDSQAWIDTTLPLDDVGSNRVELAGRLAEFVGRLQRATESLAGVRPLRDWLADLAVGIRLITRVGDADGWQWSQLQREFSDLLSRAGSRSQTPLRLSDVDAMLHRHLAGRPTRANFRTGTLTVCTMVPMRSVPHRVVCLVGLDDTVFPRAGVADGDDVLARDPMTGERDVRSEDRQLLLDAVCAATETLVITYTGANEITGQKRPPAVPLAELIDALDATTPDKVRKRIVTRHPLQPFDTRNVAPGALGVADQPFSFDPTALSAALAVGSERPAQPEFLVGPLPAPTGDDVDLAELLAFLRDPVLGFFTELQFALPREFEGVKDAMPVQVAPLDRWAVGDRMLTDITAGMDPQYARQAEWRRGLLPPGWLGCHTVNELRDQATEVAAAAARVRTGDPVARDVDIELGSGRRLSGTVSQIYAESLVSVTFSKLRGKQMLPAWVKLLALAAAWPDREWTAVCIGQGGKDDGIAERVLHRPLADPRDILEELVALYDAGRREPLPLPVKTSYAWAEARFRLASGNYSRRFPPDPGKAARGEWRYERKESAAVRVWGKEADLSALCGPPRPGEEFAGEDTRLGCLAGRLWSPLLNAGGGRA